MKIKVIFASLIFLLLLTGVVATTYLVQKPKKETPTKAVSFSPLPNEQILYSRPFNVPLEQFQPYPYDLMTWQYLLPNNELKDTNPGNFTFNQNFQEKNQLMSITGNGGITGLFQENNFGSAYYVKTSFWDSGTATAGIFLSLTSNSGSFDGTQQGIGVGIWPEKTQNRICYFHTGVSNPNRYILNTYTNREPNKWHTLEIVVTPKGSYARYDGKNLATIPNQEGANALYKNHLPFRRINLGNFFLTEGTYYYDKIEVISIPPLSSPLDISRYFVRKAVENQSISGPLWSSLWQAGVLAMDQYFNGVNHANEIKTLGSNYANTLNLPFRNPRDFDFNVMNPHSQDLWLIVAIWQYLDNTTRNQIAEKWIGVLDQIVSATIPAEPFPLGDPNFTSELYSYCPEKERFPYSSWQGNSVAEETGWEAEIMAMGAVLFSQQPHASVWKEYARFYAFHHLNKGESLAQTGNPYLYLPENLKNWKSKSIFDDGMYDNHDFHPHPQYASGSVNTAYITSKLYQKLGLQSYPELFHNVNEVYQKSVLSYIDTEYWRWKYNSQIKVKMYEWSMAYGYFDGSRWRICENDPAHPERKLGQVGSLKDASDYPDPGHWPYYGVSGLSDWGIAPYYFYQIANLVGDTQLEQQSAEFDYYSLNRGNSIFSCIGGCGFNDDIYKTAIVYLFFSGGYPIEPLFPSPTPSPTPTITPTPSLSQLSFKIKFQGISTQRTDKMAKVILRQGVEEKYRFDSIAVNSDQNGIYSGTVSNITPGTYDVFLKGWAHLQKKFANIALNAGTNTQDFSGTILKAGDFDNNNILNITDVSNLLSKYTALSVPATAENQNFDVDANNVININDVSLILANYTALEVRGDE